MCAVDYGAQFLLPMVSRSPAETPPRRRSRRSLHDPACGRAAPSRGDRGSDTSPFIRPPAHQDEKGGRNSWTKARISRRRRRPRLPRCRSRFSDGCPTRQGLAMLRGTPGRVHVLNFSQSCTVPRGSPHGRGSCVADYARKRLDIAAISDDLTTGRCAPSSRVPPALLDPGGRRPDEGTYHLRGSPTRCCSTATPDRGADLSASAARRSSAGCATPIAKEIGAP